MQCKEKTILTISLTEDERRCLQKATETLYEIWTTMKEKVGLYSSAVPTEDEDISGYDEKEIEEAYYVIDFLSGYDEYKID